MNGIGSLDLAPPNGSEGNGMDSDGDRTRDAGRHRPTRTTLDLDAPVLPRLDVLPVLLADGLTAEGEGAQAEASMSCMWAVRDDRGPSLRPVPYPRLPRVEVVRGGVNTRLWTSRQVCAIAGCTYRQLDYWLRTGVVTPSVEADGSGSRRQFDYACLRLIFAVRVTRSLGIGLTHSRDDNATGINRDMIDKIAEVEGSWAGRVLELVHDGPVVISIDLGWIEAELHDRIGDDEAVT